MGKLSLGDVLFGLAILAEHDGSATGLIIANAWFASVRRNG